MRHTHTFDSRAGAIGRREIEPSVIPERHTFKGGIVFLPGYEIRHGDTYKAKVPFWCCFVDIDHAVEISDGPRAKEESLKTLNTAVLPATPSASRAITIQLNPGFERIVRIATLKSWPSAPNMFVLPLTLVEPICGMARGTARRIVRRALAKLSGSSSSEMTCRKASPSPRPESRKSANRFSRWLLSSSTSSALNAPSMSERATSL